MGVLELYIMLNLQDLGGFFDLYRKRSFSEQYLNAGYAPKYPVTAFSEVAPALVTTHTIPVVQHGGPISPPLLEM